MEESQKVKELELRIVNLENRLKAVSVQPSLAFTDKEIETYLDIDKALNEVATTHPCECIKCMAKYGEFTKAGVISLLRLRELGR